MRYLEEKIIKDLKKKMVWVGGPRQVGKTTMAMSILKHYQKSLKKQGRYLNWDFLNDRKDILSLKWDDDDKLLIFDEIHKYKRWKNYLKGLYDKLKHQHNFLVTGSARLNVFKKGGDSLLGRYHYWRLHPFSLFEVPKKLSKKECFKRLMTVGGFPEPFLDNDLNEARRWRRERFERILKDDIRDLELIRDIQSLELFVDALRRRVGSPIVLSNLAEDLQITQKTLNKWLLALEKMYVIFIVRPYSKNIPRAIQKPPKIYFFDNADVIGDEGAIFENFVATHLLKRIQFYEDTMGYRYELKYIRDKEKREVDFAVFKDRELESLIEVKCSDEKISRHLQYYSEKLNPRSSLQIVSNLKRSFSVQKLRVISPFQAFEKL